MLAKQRNRIVELFEIHREKPGAAYDENCFLNFLIAKPMGNKQVRDSFRGLRRLDAFFDAVQLEFAVCFSVKDRETNYSLTKFVSRVATLQASRASSLRSLKNQENAGSGVLMPSILANLALLTIGLAVSSTIWALVIVFLIAVAANAFLARFSWNERRYRRTLKRRIETSEA